MNLPNEVVNVLWRARTQLRDIHFGYPACDLLESPKATIQAISEVLGEDYDIDRGEVFESPNVEPMKHWMRHYDAEAKKQGWSLFNADGEVQIQKIDEPEESDTELGDDCDALSLVSEAAADGCVMALVALYFDGRPVGKEVYLPIPLCPLERSS